MISLRFVFSDPHQLTYLGESAGTCPAFLRAADRFRGPGWNASSASGDGAEEGRVGGSVFFLGGVGKGKGLLVSRDWKQMRKRGALVRLHS